MMSRKHGTMALLLTCASMSTLALAHEKRPSAKRKTATMSCGDFVSIDDAEKPKIIYWAEGLSHQGKTEDAYVDVGDTDRLVPIMVGECSKEPKESFWTKFKAEIKKIT
jgi:acid stress chaperone HdeA